MARALGKRAWKQNSEVIPQRKHKGPVPMAARSKARTVFDRLNTGIAGSNPDGGMNVCPSFSVSCCPV
jgi:hypothetical protein